MKYVCEDKELTDANKDTLKNASTWQKVIDAICHYIWKTITLGLGQTQKEARDSFNSFLEPF